MSRKFVPRTGRKPRPFVVDGRIYLALTLSEARAMARRRTR